MSYRDNYVRDIRNYFKSMLECGYYVQDKTGVKTIELVGASFVADEPTIFGEPNHDYIDREIAWYKSQSRYINDIPGGPPAIWKEVADDHGYINSNYGWCIWSDENNTQYLKVRDELIKNPNTRRAIMIYTRPTMWEDYKENGRSDFMCTNAVQYLIRNDRLYTVVQMRSNDVVYGYKNDWAWQKYVQNKLASDLGVETGDIHWNVGSLHVYERHFDLVQ